MRDHPDAEPVELVSHIMDSLDRFTDFAVQADDRTVVAVRLTPAIGRGVSAEHAQELTFAAA